RLASAVGVSRLCSGFAADRGNHEVVFAERKLHCLLDWRCGQEGPVAALKPASGACGKACGTWPIFPVHLLKGPFSRLHPGTFAFIGCLPVTAIISVPYHL
ncbi:hypothetical protein, partial [Roseobacter weihaiensis]|uniref:hypothetical protein n=1 Tax=Roseobacter weihaiensis TaxID=2763262 RepID=UPI001D0A7730